MSCFADTYQIIRIISASKIKKLGYASVLVMTSKNHLFPVISLSFQETQAKKLRAIALQLMRETQIEYIAFYLG